MKFILGLFLLLAPLVSMASDVCEPNVDSCGFYLCQEKSHHCGSKGYPVGFGFKFCQIYLHSEKNYSPAAHTWLRRVRVCLMEEFAKADIENSRRTCSEIKGDGFESHAGCYVKTGFCELSGADYLQIFWAMKSSAIHAEIFKDAHSVAKACAHRGNPVPAFFFSKFQ
ncbi:MAG: hypothetical protein JSU04_11985 [Bdellovibrionales bacterium]|nr:hypothetical protein [Bdellovibrionales bacterium]